MACNQAQAVTNPPVWTEAAYSTRGDGLLTTGMAELSTVLGGRGLDVRYQAERCYGGFVFSHRSDRRPTAAKQG